jgi:S1-C subfamily serine protease
VRRVAFLGTLLLAAAVSAPAQRQFSLVPDKEFPTLQESLQDLELPEGFPDAASMVAKVLDPDDAWVASATVVRADGWLITKASDWPEGGRIALPDGRVLVPTQQKVETTNDVALVHVEAADLFALPLAASAAAETGDWLLAFSPGEDEPRLGVLSAHPRASEREGGVIGVIMGREGNGGVRVAQVAPESGAAEAGVQVGDWLVAVEGEPVDERLEVQEYIQRHDPGSRVRVTIRREEEEKELEILLGSRNIVFDLFNRNQLMSGPTSMRHSGFEEALQHDLPLTREEVGIPLFDLEGRWVGLNLARRNRVEGFALTPAVVQKTLQALLPPLADAP